VLLDSESSRILLAIKMGGTDEQSNIETLNRKFKNLFCAVLLNVSYAFKCRFDLTTSSTVTMTNDFVTQFRPF